ncbi:MAG: CRISPR-associated endonuclease Cas2 [Eubacteriales bacterium]
MSFRFMRVIVMFDLPSTSSGEQREYRKFRRHLMKTGFMMVQESVYSKLALNPSAAHAVEGNLKKNKPPDGLVMVLTVTEKQYNSMEIIVGEKQRELLDTTDRFVCL